MKTIDPFIPFCVALAFLSGVGLMVAINHLYPSRSSLPSVESAPHYTPSDNAIARFGAAPVNPQWYEVMLQRKDGRPVDHPPAPDEIVFRVPYEPIVEKLPPPKERDWEPTIWTITFKP